MDLIYDSLIILAPLWILWLVKNYNRKRVIFFFVNVVFFLFSPILLVLLLFIIEDYFHYLLLIYIWFLISYFSVSLIFKKKRLVVSIALACLFNTIILSSIWNIQGQFYYWSYWRHNYFLLNEHVVDKYACAPKDNSEEIYSLVKCEIKTSYKYDRVKNNLRYHSIDDTIVQFKSWKSYKFENVGLDIYEYVSYRLPSTKSEFKDLFEKETKSIAIVTDKGIPKRFIKDMDLQSIMADCDYYYDFLIFKWENTRFWNNLLKRYSSGIRDIERLKKC